MFMTSLHWIVVAVFVLLFILLVLLSVGEKNKKTFVSMIFSSLILVGFGMLVSLFALDKYTKKAKLINSTQTRDLRKERVIVRGKIKNIGNFKIGYCKVEVRISNQMKHGRGTKSYFTPNKSLGNIFGSKDIKSNTIIEEFIAVEDLKPKKSKNFVASIPFPPHFDNPKYRLKLYCH